MKMVADMSLYPLKNEPIPDIIEFIKDLQQRSGIEIVSNQLTTQICGEFEAVTSAINECMKKTMQAPNTVVLMVKYLNVEKSLQATPSLT